MEVIPAIDIRGGKAVRLFQGDYGRETVFQRLARGCRAEVARLGRDAASRRRP